MASLFLIHPSPLKLPRHLLLFSPVLCPVGASLKILYYKLKIRVRASQLGLEPSGDFWLLLSDYTRGSFRTTKTSDLNTIRKVTSSIVDWSIFSVIVRHESRSGD